MLSDDGSNRFSTSSTVNIAELVALCGEQPGRRILNAVDEDKLSVAEIARTVFEIMDRDVEVVTFPGPPVDNLGSTPWTVAHPLILSMAAATVELGYRQPTNYADSVAAAVDWAVREVELAERRGDGWDKVFPTMAARAQSRRLVRLRRRERLSARPGHGALTVPRNAIVESRAERAAASFRWNWYSCGQRRARGPA